MEELKILLQNPAAAVPLDIAALQLAHLEYPDLNIGNYQAQLDTWAAWMRQGPIDSLHGQDFVREFHHFVFDELGFHGNREDYYSPLNSFLNEVMERRQGIPITLSVVYMELARRLGRTVLPVNFPGHFLVKVEDADFACFVDVFARGTLLTEDDCYSLGLAMTGLDYRSRPEVLQPVDNRSVLLRMLQNLRGIYISRRANRKLLAVMDLLLLAVPENAEEWLTRAMVKMNLHLHAGAERDLQEYLRLRPEADDKGEIAGQLRMARMLRSQMN